MVSVCSLKNEMFQKCFSSNYSMSQKVAQPYCQYIDIKKEFKESYRKTDLI